MTSTPARVPVEVGEGVPLDGLSAKLGLLVLGLLIGYGLAIMFTESPPQVLHIVPLPPSEHDRKGR